VANSNQKTTTTTTTTTINCCIQILYKLEEILQFIIITHTISEDILCAPMGQIPVATCIILPDARRGDDEAPGHFGHLESFPYAYSKSVAIIFIIIIYYNYLNLYRHRKSFRRKHTGNEPEQNKFYTGVYC